MLFDTLQSKLTVDCITDNKDSTLERIKIFYLPMHSRVASVMSYVGITMSRESSDPHHENNGMCGFSPVLTSGQSPKLKSISMSGR